jgi:hypothetical protein
VWDWSIIDLDPHIITEISKFPCCELSPIICHDVVRNTELIHDLWNKLNFLGSHYGGSRLCFDPLGELVHRHKNMCESSTLIWSKWSVWSVADWMGRAFGEQNIGILHSDELGSRCQIRQLASRTIACMLFPWVFMHLCGFHILLSWYLEGWSTLLLWGRITLILHWRFAETAPQKPRCGALPTASIFPIHICLQTSPLF